MKRIDENWPDITSNSLSKMKPFRNMLTNGALQYKKKYDLLQALLIPPTTMSGDSSESENDDRPLLSNVNRNQEDEIIPSDPLQEIQPGRDQKIGILK